MQKYSIYAQKLRQSIWLVVTLFVLLGFLFSNVDGNTYFALLMEPRTTVSSPSVVLRAGTVGSSIVYVNGTSARISAVAPIPTPTNYDYVLKVVNNVSDLWKIRLKAYSQSNIGRLSNCTIYFRNASNGFSGQVCIVNGNYTQQTGPWYDLPASPAERYIAVILQANNSEVSYINVYLEILIPDKTTYAQYILTFEFT
jgi:hypothetical protein